MLLINRIWTFIFVHIYLQMHWPDFSWVQYFEQKWCARTADFKHAFTVSVTQCSTCLKATTSVHKNIPEPSRLSTLWPGVYSKPHKFFDTTAYLSSSSSSSSSERRVAPKSEPSVLDMKSTGVLDTLGLLFICLIKCGEILNINKQSTFLKTQWRSYNG